MLEDVTSPLLLLILSAAAMWLTRALLPAVTCPHCRSESWLILGDMKKQCSRCGRLFT
jgi:hypothetical protein